MHGRHVSFLIASTVLVVSFFVIHSIRHNEGQAQAAAGAVSAGILARDVEYSRSDRRAVRRAMLSGDEYLLGLSGADVRAVLNQPELVRRDLPTVVWQYRNDSCVLDLYFKAVSAKVSMSPVVYYEVRARQKNVTDAAVQDGCLKNLVRARAGSRFVSLAGFYKSN